MEIIVRKRYLDHILSHINRGMMIVLIGQRRVGKSFMLRQVVQWLKENNANANIVSINKELYEFRDVTDAPTLYDYVTSRLVEDASSG